MTRFSDELRIIPRVAWAIAVVLAVGLFVLLYIVVLPHDAKTQHWPDAGQIAFSIWPGLLLGTIVLLVGYINADARRRGMRYILWTLLAIFLPNSIGIILYFVLRDPLPVPCSRCGASGRSTFAFCTECGAPMATACPACRNKVESGWKRCAHCGVSLTAPRST